MIEIKMALDLNKRPANFDPVEIRQGEENAVVIRAEIYDGGYAVDLSQYEVLFECTHPGGAPHSDNDQLSVSGNVITYTVSELVGSEPGMISNAYFALKADGVYATTQTFPVRVLPNATQEGAGMAKAYSSEINAMLDYCETEFTKDEAARQATFNENETARQSESEAATARANAAADLVEQAVDGNLNPLFGEWIDGQKNVEGGLVGYDKYVKDHTYLTNTRLLEVLEL